MSTERTEGVARKAGLGLIAFAALHAANWAVAALRLGDPAPFDFVFAMALLAACAVLAKALSAGRRWAWWGSLVVVVGALILVAPVVGTMVLGGGLEPVGTGWDGVYFPALVLVLVLTLIGLLACREPVVRHDPG